MSQLNQASTCFCLYRCVWQCLLTAPVYLKPLRYNHFLISIQKLNTVIIVLHNLFIYLKYIATLTSLFVYTLRIKPITDHNTTFNIHMKKQEHCSKPKRKICHVLGTCWTGMAGMSYSFCFAPVVGHKMLQVSMEVVYTLAGWICSHIILFVCNTMQQHVKGITQLWPLVEICHENHQV